MVHFSIPTKDTMFDIYPVVKEHIIFETELCELYSTYSPNSDLKCHLLITFKSSPSSIQEISIEELQEMNTIAAILIKMMKATYPDCDTSFAIQNGKPAGMTVFTTHCHVCAFTNGFKHSSTRRILPHDELAELTTFFRQALTPFINK